MMTITVISVKIHFLFSMIVDDFTARKTSK